MRALSALMALAMVAVFLLPSTFAVYRAVDGTAWNLQDVQTFPVQLLAPALSLFAVTSSPVHMVVVLLQADLSHPVAQVPLFELDCALIR